MPRRTDDSLMSSVQQLLPVKSPTEIASELHVPLPTVRVYMKRLGMSAMDARALRRRTLAEDTSVMVVRCANCNAPIMSGVMEPGVPRFCMEVECRKVYQHYVKEKAAAAGQNKQPSQILADSLNRTRDLVQALVQQALANQKQTEKHGTCVLCGNPTRAHIIKYCEVHDPR